MEDNVYYTEHSIHRVREHLQYIFDISGSENAPPLSGNFINENEFELSSTRLDGDTFSLIKPAYLKGSLQSEEEDITIIRFSISANIGFLLGSISSVFMGILAMFSYLNHREFDYLIFAIFLVLILPFLLALFAYDRKKRLKLAFIHYFKLKIYK